MFYVVVLGVFELFRLDYIVNIEVTPGLPYNNSGYGFWYNWDAAMNGSTTEGAQGICAAGWHIPSDNDWNILEGALGTSKAEQNKKREDAIDTRYRGTDQGAQLKVGGGSGFGIFITGYSNPAFNWNASLINASHIWTSSESGDDKAWNRAFTFGPLDQKNAYLAPHMDQVNRNHLPKNVRISVRCLKD